MANMASGLGRTGKAQPPDAGVGDKRSTDLFADALDEIEDAGWEARLVDEVEQHRAREGRPLSGLEHDGAACRQRGSGLPRREHEWRVPRSNHDGRAARIAHDAVRGPIRLPESLFVLARKVGVGSEVAGTAADYAGLERTLEHRHVPALNLGDVVDVCVDQLGESVEIRRASLRTERRPGRKGANSSTNRSVRCSGVAATDVCEQRAVDRRPVLEGGGATDPGAIDVVLGRDGVPMNLDASAHSPLRRSAIVSRSSTV